MSDEDTTTDVTEDTSVAEVKVKRNSIPTEEVTALVDGLPQWSKASFLMVGYKGGVRLALPKTAGVSRAYFYGDDNYDLVPQDDAITVFSEAQRKELRKGGIMAEVNFALGVDAARQALGKLVEAVRTAPVPVVKEPRVPKKPKAVAAAQPAVAEVSVDDTERLDFDDDDTDELEVS